MKPLLLHARPLQVATGSRIDCRVGSALSPAAYGLGGMAWRPAMAQRPSVTIELMSLDLSGSVMPARMTVAIATNELPKNVRWQALKWIGAPITLYAVDDLSWEGRKVQFEGEVQSHRLDIEDGIIRLTCDVSTRQLERNLLFATFGGTGGLDGEPEMRGTPLPAGFGKKGGIEPVWFDKTRWIGMLDGYANLEAVDRLLEGGSSMGASVGDFPTYTALATAIDDKTIAPGRWGTCLAYGLVGMGAPPFKTIQADARFGGNRIGAVISDLARLHAGLPAAKIDTPSLNALDAAVPFDIGLWYGDQRQVKDVIEFLAGAANATPILLPDNRLAVTRAVSSSPVATLDRSGAQVPRVVEWQVAEPVKPFWQIKARTARPAKVLTFDEVNYEDDIIDRGGYRAEETYRAGNLVWAPDKSSYLYINETAGSGHALPAAPATANDYWQQLSPPATAGDLTYEDGTPIEELRPAAPLARPNTDIAISGGAITGIGAGNGTPVDNSNISIGANGQLTGGGGGQVTLPGIDTVGVIPRTIRLSTATGRVNSSRALPPIIAMNLQYRFTGSINYTAAADGTATISAGAGQALVGTAPIPYNPMSVNVSGGTPGGSRLYQLYVQESSDPAQLGGTKTLIATTAGNSILNNDNNVWIGVVTVNFPSSGSGSGSGGSGGGGGGYDPNEPILQPER